MDSRHKIHSSSNKFFLTEEQELETARPADFSFKKYTYLKSVAVESARVSRIGLPLRNPSSGRFITRALWLNNNRLQHFGGLERFVNSVIDDPSRLAWLDFSYNHIQDIDHSIQEYPNLKIVYLHGNNIANVDELLKLRELRELKTVTFHGNPISEEPNYRISVINILPQISVLDFTPILKSERLYPPPRDIQKLLTTSEIQNITVIEN